MADKTYTIKEIRELVETLGLTQKNDPASLTVNTPTLQGPFPGNTNQLGIFSNPAVRPGRFSALVRPQSLASLIQMTRSVFHQERLEIMTGVTAAAGTNATGFCGDPPTVGQGKVCEQDYDWGRYDVKTNLESMPEMGTLASRAEVPGEIINAGPSANPLVPDIMYSLADPRSQLQYALWRIGVHTERVMGQVLIQGDKTLNSTQTHLGWISEPLGLDSMIKTGYTDSKTGIACPAADSAVLSFNADIGSDVAGADDRNIVLALSDQVWGILDRAAEMNMAGIQIALVGRKELFRALVDVWACNYATYRCSSSNAGQPFTNDVQVTNALRLEMMSGQYILIDNVPIPFVFEEGVPQDVLGGNIFKSDLYIVPIAWDGIPLLRGEYFPMDNEYIKEWGGFQGEPPAVINNGMYMVVNRNNGFCKEYLFGAKFRFILETPFLAGRVDDIRYTMRAPIRNSNPSDTWFYADGGLTYRTA